MRFKDRIKDKIDDIKTYKVADEIKSHVTNNKVAYLCGISAAGGIALTILVRRSNKVEVNVTVNFNEGEF